MALTRTDSTAVGRGDVGAGVGLTQSEPISGLMSIVHVGAGGSGRRDRIEGSRAAFTAEPGDRSGSSIAALWQGRMGARDKARVVDLRYEALP